MTRLPVPRRILMTVDAVGGVWRYAMDLARGLSAAGITTVFAGFGPEPDDAKRREAEALGKLVWLTAPLDWMAQSERDLCEVGPQIAALAAREGVDLLHLNLPSQAVDLVVERPVVTVSHSCVVTWFSAVRGHSVPEPWAWQERVNAEGLRRSDAVVVPSGSHADMITRSYGVMLQLSVVYNATRLPAETPRKEPFVFAAGRWWDDGKNGRALDEAAEHTHWPILMAGPTRGPSGQQVALLAAKSKGELSHSDTMNHLVKAAIFVSPSIYEPFGLAALEAARLGAALVLSDIPTYRELWQDAALFVDPHDPRAIADAINRLSHDSALRLALSTRSQAVSSAFTLERQVNDMTRIYQRALARQSLHAVAESS
ncbi:glycosyltransferase family 4 protein [Allorhizobium pseudoryzae]|uniref:glycosyltransferase family 4 protein n=1 Tax=Allorhizobium pseudoryzae TaxID=379684 RepID=UPI003CFD9648